MFKQSILYAVLCLMAGIVPTSMAAATELDVTPLTPLVMGNPGSSVLVEVLITNSTPDVVYLNSVSSDLTESFATPDLFNEFVAVAPESLLSGESWEGPLVRLTIAPDAPIASKHRVTVSFSGGDHPYDDQSLATFTFALNDPAAVAGVPIGLDPLAGALKALPNPTRGSADISFVLVAPGHVDIQVYDVLGTAVRTLARGLKSVGPQSVSWNGRNDRGDRVDPGVYFVKLMSGDRVRSTKVVRIK